MPDIHQPICTLHQLLLVEAGACYSGERQLLDELPGWIFRAQSPKLREILNRYQSLVQQHINKLGQLLMSEGLPGNESSNPVFHSFTASTDEKLASCGDPEVCDAALLASIQAINHYKISRYGTAAAWSRVLQREEEATLLHEAEVNEKQIDDRLTQLARFEINEKAIAPIQLTE